MMKAEVANWRRAREIFRHVKENGVAHDGLLNLLAIEGYDFPVRRPTFGEHLTLDFVTKNL